MFCSLCVNGADARFCLLTLHTQRVWLLQWFQRLPPQWGHKYMNNISKTDLRVTSRAFYHFIWVKLESYHIHTELWRGHMMWFQVLLSLWSVTSWLCIDKIPEVAKTKVSKPKRYSLSKLRLCHAPLKRLVQTRPHMSTSRCGNICVRRGFSNAVVLKQVSGRHCEQQRILWTTISWT